MNKIARVIITFDCNRKCPNCCNNYRSIIDKAITINDLEALKEYPVICVTGGEPMLDPGRTLGIIKQLKANNPDVIIYLYTAFYNHQMYEIIPLVDGIHFSMHAEATSDDIDDFESFQCCIGFQTNKSFRLYIDAELNKLLDVHTDLFSRIEKKPWIMEGECLLPPNETLYILETG